MITELVNGGVYKDGYRVFVLIFITTDRGTEQWGMLSIERHRVKGMSAPCFQRDAHGEYVFSEEELTDKFKRESWKRLDGRLRIEKIDNMSLVEYPYGDLEVMKGD